MGNANVYNINFVGFKIRALDEGQDHVLWEVASDPHTPPESEEDDSSRFIRYHFGPMFLDYPNIGTTLVFQNGPYELRNFRMIERHYFGNTLIKSYDFTMPFVIPNTTNTWEVIYSMPELDHDLKQQIAASPWETKSDSFYFVDGQLVMHNKAEYNYSEHPC